MPTHTTALRPLLLDSESMSNTYAILDGASIPDLLPQLDAAQPDHVCLYRGELSHGIDAVAPYLVHLEPDHAFTAWLLSQGWGQHYGVFFHSNAGIPVLRHHLRRLLRVYSEQGRPFLFRFYDPRVLRVYAPSLNALEAQRFFGPIDSFLMEAEDAKAVLRFTRHGGTVQGARREWAGHQDWTVLSESPTVDR